MIRKLPLAALALACVAFPAFAQTAADAGGVTVPWGTWLTNALLAVSTAAVPILTTFAVKGIQQVAPWAALFLSQQRIEAMVRNSLDYALNAVEGATKDQKLTVPVGSAVIAKAVQRALDAAPAKVIAAAGGPQGIAERVFRMLHLVENATAANVLAPAQAAIPRK